MVRRYTKEEVTGWIPESTRGFSNETGFREIGDWRNLSVDEASLSYFSMYAEKNFSGPLVRGMGTEEILDVLHRWGSGGAWLDLGAGTSTVFWACALDAIRSVTVADASLEALVVLHGMVCSSDVPQCSRDVLAMYGRDPGHLARIRGLGWRYLVFDFAQAWPPELAGDEYDLITAFGCFGLADGEDHFRRSVSQAASHLAPGGTLIGANWLRTSAAIRAKGYDTTFFTEEFVTDVLGQHGLDESEVTITPIRAEELYESIIVWVGRKAAATSQEDR